MAGNGFVAALLAFLFVADAFSVSFTMSFRKLGGPEKSSSSPQSPESPPPNHVSVAKKSGDEARESNKSPEVTKTSSSLASKGQNGRVPVTPRTPLVDQKENEKNHDKKEEKDLDQKTGTADTCNGKRSCTSGPLTACIQRFEPGLKKLEVLIQNKGDNALKISLSQPMPAGSKELEISKHNAAKLNISLTTGASEVILNAGNGDCTLQLEASESNTTALLYLPSFDKLITPINGAYFLILTVIVFAGVWACCVFGKRRRCSDFKYQELEMGAEPAAFETNPETAAGWDQDWDDDWDEENAVKSPGSRRIGNISANGLTARPTNRVGWENDWDD